MRVETDTAERSVYPVARAKDMVVVRVQEVIEPVLGSLGYACVHVEQAFENGRKTIRVFIDRLDEAKGPVSIEDCVRATHELDPVLDVADVVPGRWELEVSSPGVNRPLSRREDFEKFSGKKVAVRTFEKVGDRRNFLGILRGVSGDEILIDVDGRELRVPLEEVSKAHLDVL